jgi:hypothetical protein
MFRERNHAAPNRVPRKFSTVAAIWVGRHGARFDVANCDIKLTVPPAKSRNMESSGK